MRPRRDLVLPDKRRALCRLTLKDEMLVFALCPNLKLWQTRNLPLSEHDKPGNARYGTRAF